MIRTLQQAVENHSASSNIGLHNEQYTSTRTQQSTAWSVGTPTKQDHHMPSLDKEPNTNWFGHVKEVYSRRNLQHDKLQQCSSMLFCHMTERSRVSNSNAFHCLLWVCPYELASYGFVTIQCNANSIVVCSIPTLHPACCH